MKRSLAAACAAVLLAGSLTACSDTKNNATPNAGDNNNNANPSGTAYTAPGQVRNYTGTNGGSQYGGLSDGRYTAYSDGTVDDGRGALAQQGGSLTGDMARGARDLTRSAENAVENAGQDVGGALRNAANAK